MAEPTTIVFRYVALSLGLAILGSYLLLSKRKKKSDNNYGENLEVLYSKLGAFAQIVTKSYDSGMGPCSVEYGPWCFDLRQRYSEGFISVWKVISKPTGATGANIDALFPIQGGEHDTFIVVVRGSHLALDWAFLDVMLALLPTRFLEVVRNRFSVLTSDLEQLLPRTENVQVVYAGHSLGASVAEMFCHLSKTSDYPLWKRVKCVGALTFDSPGIDPEIHQELGVNPRSPGIVIVNSAVNIVNMLFKPCCERLYACGRGSQITFSHLTYLSVMIAASPLTGLLSALKDNADEHPMTKIIAYIIDKQVNLADRDDWWNVSGWFVGILKRIARSMFKSPHVSVTPPQPTPAPEQEYVTVAASETQRSPFLERVPINIDLLPNKVPYYIGVEKLPNGKFLSDLHDFISQRAPSDFFIPVIGYTGVGKSSFIRAVLGLTDVRNDHRIPIAEGEHPGNCSKEILVAAYQGGATTRPNKRFPDIEMRTRTGTAHLADLSEDYKMVAGCAVWVIDTTLPYDHVINDVKDFLRATKFSLLVVVNNKEKFAVQSQRKLAAIKTKLVQKEVVKSDLDVIMVEANVQMDSVEISKFHPAINSMIERYGQEINNTIRGDADEFITSEEGQLQVKAEIEKRRTWSRFFSNAGTGTVLTLVGAGVCAASFAVTGGLAGAAYVAYYGTATVMTTAGIAGGAAAGGGVVGTGIMIPTSIHESGLQIKNEAIAAVKKAYMAANTITRPVGNTRIFLLDIPGHGIKN